MRCFLFRVLLRQDELAEEVQEHPAEPHDPVAVNRAFNGGAGLSCVSEGGLDRVQTMLDAVPREGRGRRQTHSRAALDAVVAENKRTEPVMKKAKFERLAQDTFKELLAENPVSFVSRLGRDAMLALQVAVEASIELFMADVQTMCEHARRQTVHLEDARAVRLFRQRWGDRLYIPMGATHEDEQQPASGESEADTEEFWRQDRVQHHAES